MTRDGKREIDTTDSSVTRSLNELRAVLESAGLRCIRVQKQERFPRVLYPVYMFALRPSLSTETPQQVKIENSVDERTEHNATTGEAPQVSGSASQLEETTTKLTSTEL